ncbi:peptidoglycan DD-metalloendopeptidase family protein [Vibrio sp. WXL103]|uniref:M23 family metallopeptidase n=1 Tax=Vibrio sp. WXL103 TaxID=3450710 RepID=UPI003EC94148
MSKKITIQVPAAAGEQHFALSRVALSGLLFVGTVCIGATAAYIHSSQTQIQQLHQALSASQQESMHSRQQHRTLLKTQHDLEMLLAEQEDEVHQLNQDLASKQQEIKILGQRVYDVEHVLGLTDETDATYQEQLEQRIDAAALNSAVRATLLRLLPNDTPVNFGRVSSSFGRRTNPITGKVHTHTGIDLTCQVGEPIYAPADGVIETVRPSDSGFGNFLTVRHAYGFMTSYAHLHQFKARSGAFVAKGDQIATCGNSGNSTGPHLHYEIRFLGRALNPQYSIDWSPDNFDYLFEKEKRVNWQPLLELVDNSVRMQVNLTNAPSSSPSLKTASHETDIDRELSTQ